MHLLGGPEIRYDAMAGYQFGKDGEEVNGDGPLNGILRTTRADLRIKSYTPELHPGVPRNNCWGRKGALVWTKTWLGNYSNQLNAPGPRITPPRSSCLAFSTLQLDNPCPQFAWYILTSFIRSLVCTFLSH